MGRAPGWMGREPGQLAWAQTEQVPAHGAHSHTGNTQQYSSAVRCSQLDLSLPDTPGGICSEGLSCVTDLGKGRGGRQGSWGGWRWRQGSRGGYGGWRGRQSGWGGRHGGWCGRLGLLNCCIAWCLHSHRQQLSHCLNVRACWDMLQTTHCSEGIASLRLSVHRGRTRQSPGQPVSGPWAAEERCCCCYCCCC